MAREKGVYHFCFKNKSPYHETIDFDVQVAHFAYHDQHAQDGFNIETLEYKNISFEVWDIGAYNMIHLRLRHHFTQNVQGLIFVVDSVDRDYVNEAKEELHLLFKEDGLRDALLLVFANKQDLPGAMNATEIVDKLDLHSLGLQHWHILSGSATTGEGLYEGLDWLANNIANKA